MSLSGGLVWLSSITYADGETPGVKLKTCTFDIARTSLTRGNGTVSENSTPPVCRRTIF